MIIAGVLLFFMYYCMHNYNLNKSDVSIIRWRDTRASGY